MPKGNKDDDLGQKKTKPTEQGPRDVNRMRKGVGGVSNPPEKTLQFVITS